MQERQACTWHSHTQTRACARTHTHTHTHTCKKTHLHITVVSGPVPPALAEGVSGDQSGSDSDVVESVPDTPQPISVGEEALTDSAPAPRADNTQSVGSPHSSKGEGATLLADPHVRHRQKWAEQKGEWSSTRLKVLQRVQLKPPP